MTLKWKYFRSMIQFRAAIALLEKNIRWLYLVYAIPMITLTALITPPFQIPDEPNHFCRAEQVSRLEVLARFHREGQRSVNTGDPRVLIPDKGGYLTDKGIEMANSFYLYIPFNAAAKVQASQIALSKNISWRTGMTDAPFPNTAIYPPSGYLVAALGISIGKALHRSVIDTLYLSRWLNGLFCVLLCCYALGLARSSRLLMFTVLLFPSTVSLFASVSQDGTLISLAFLFAALVDHVESGEKKVYSPGQLAIMVGSIIALSAAKPPYLLLSLVFFVLSCSRRTKIICFSISVLATLSWMLLNAGNYALAWAPVELKVNARLQLHYIFSHPFRYAGLFFRLNFSAIRDHLLWFVALSGWEDTLFPAFFYKTALLVWLGVIVSTAHRPFRDRLRIRTGMILAALLSLIAIMTALYVTWAPLESPVWGNMQSRYFIPLFPFLALAITGFSNDRSPKSWQAPIIACAMLLPVLSHIVTILTLLNRYYL